MKVSDEEVSVGENLLPYTMMLFFMANWFLSYPVLRLQKHKKKIELTSNQPTRDFPKPDR